MSLSELLDVVTILPLIKLLEESWALKNIWPPLSFVCPTIKAWFESYRYKTLLSDLFLSLSKNQYSIVKLFAPKSHASESVHFKNVLASPSKNTDPLMAFLPPSPDKLFVLKFAVLVTS